MITLTIVANLCFASTPVSPAPVSTYTFADPCKPHVTMAAVPNTTGCYSFTASVGANPSSGSYFSWQFGDGAAATGVHVSQCYAPVTSPAYVTGTLTYNSPALCGPNNTSTSFTLTLNPASNASCVVAGPDILKAALSVTVPSGVTYPEMMRTIDYADGGGFSSLNTHHYALCGSYVITIKSWDMNFPNDICYAYKAVNLSCNSVPTKVKENGNLVPRIFPNPSVETVNVKSEKRIKSVSVNDLLGKELMLCPGAEGSKTTLYTGTLTPGTFVMKIVYFDNTVDFVRFLKE